MEAFLSFIETLPTYYKLIWILVCLGIAWLLEGGIPFITDSYNKWRHAGKNMIFLSTTIVVNFLFGLATVGLFIWTAQNDFGLINWLDLPIGLELLLSIMLLDFIGQYVAHVFVHKYKIFWKFHMVHHSDTMVDATTGTRHHPGDYFVRESFAIAGVFLGGIPVSYYLIYRFLSIIFTYFTHANIQLPKVIDKAISLVFVTPYMHKFHHHFERPWTDSNFGNMFSIWDRLFGTLVYEDINEVRYGVDVLDDKKSEDVLYQFKIPFDKTIKTD